MTDESKKIILEISTKIASTVECFEKLNHHMTISPDVKKNSMIALAELMNCIKHLALVHGDITGKELMPSVFLEEFTAKHQEEQAH